MHRHFIFNKPFNCLSQFIFEGKRKTGKRLLGQFYDFPKATMAIGRLDNDSEGLLFLTTDGKVSEKIRSEKYEKEYYVMLTGEITEKAVSELQKGVEIGFEGKKYITKPCEVKVISKPTNLPIIPRKINNEKHRPCSWISITIREGKFRQVRKMTAAVGFPTLRLIRVRIGNIKLSLNAEEVLEVLNFDSLQN